MVILDTLLFGFVAVLLGLKVFLLAAAAMLLIFGMSKRISEQRPVEQRRMARTHQIDVHA